MSGHLPCNVVLHFTPGPHLSPSVVVLQASNGYSTAIAFTGAQPRTPVARNYSISKHALNLLIELVALGDLGP